MDSDAERSYWSDLKHKLHDDEGVSELCAKIAHMELRSPLGGKQYRRFQKPSHVARGCRIGQLSAT